MEHSTTTSQLPETLPSPATVGGFGVPRTRNPKDTTTDATSLSYRLSQALSESCRRDVVRRRLKSHGVVFSLISGVLVLALILSVLAIAHKYPGMDDGFVDAAATSANITSLAPPVAMTLTSPDSNGLPATTVVSAITSIVSSVVATTTLRAKTTLSTSTVTSPTVVPSFAACARTETFKTGVAWIGIADETDGWDVAYGQALHPEHCCNLCLGAAWGCAGWAFEQGGFTPCNMISMDGANPDATCPKGHVDGISVKYGGSMTAGLGPCAPEIADV